MTTVHTFRQRIKQVSLVIILSSKLFEDLLDT